MSIPEDWQDGPGYSITQLTQLHDWCRAHGVSQLRVGNVHMVLDEQNELTQATRTTTAALPQSPHEVIRRKAREEG